MSIESALSVALGCGILTWLLTGLVRRHAIRHAMLDVPNARSSHVQPTARGGGLAIVATFLPCVALLLALHLLDIRTAAALLGGSTAVAGVGYLDDRRTLPASVRLAVHVLSAVWVVTLLGGLTEEALRVFGIRGIYTGAVFAVVALVWMTNLFNFMDGIDGIAASETAFIAGAALWLGSRQSTETGLMLALLALAAGAAGFLVWNWPPARIFLGDVGSGFLGFTLGALALAASGHRTVPIEVWVILGGAFVVDATVTLSRRAARGDRCFEAHRMHAYQHLARRWRSHRRVTVSVLIVDLVWLLPWAWLATEYPGRSRWCVLAALAPLVVLALYAGAGSEE